MKLTLTLNVQIAIRIKTFDSFCHVHFVHGGIDFCAVVTKAGESTIAVQRKHTRGLFSHFLSVTIVKGFPAIIAAAVKSILPM